MRIVINGPPKQGHRWLKCILGNIYGLSVMGGSRKPESRPNRVREWIAAGGFPDGSIYHQHVRFSPRLCDALESAPAHLVAVVRDPYDAFVSFYYWVQDRAEHGEGFKKERPRHDIIGKPLDDPEVVAYLAEEYESMLLQAVEWVMSGRVPVVRYEGLHRDPLAEVRKVTDLIEPVADERITQTLEFCSAANMRERSQRLARHVRSGVVGDSKQRLTEAHLAVFRDRFPDHVRALGYEIR